MDKGNESTVAAEEAKKPIVSSAPNGYLNQTELLATLEDFKERIETLEINAATVSPPTKTGSGG